MFEDAKQSMDKTVHSILMLLCSLVTNLQLSKKYLADIFS